MEKDQQLIQDKMEQIVENELENKKYNPVTSSQKRKLEYLMRNMDKPIKDARDENKEKLPLCFQTPDIIQSIWGSSAAAGSGEFHVYRGIRRREAARQGYLKRQVEEEEKQRKFEEKIMLQKEKEELTTSKKRLKRKRAKERKINFKNNTENIIQDEQPSTEKKPQKLFPNVLKNPHI